MLQVDAIRILARLTAAFPTVELDEDQADALLKELTLLHDPSILNAAVSQIIHNDEKFPAIARIRGHYRTIKEVNEGAVAALERAKESEKPKNDVPEWVQVWAWWRDHTVQARIDANTAMAQCPPEHRPPVKMREFPQLPQPLAPDAYSWEEYHKIRDEWVEAGAPNVGAAEILDVAGVSE